MYIVRDSMLFDPYRSERHVPPRQERIHGHDGVHAIGSNQQRHHRVALSDPLLTRSRRHETEPCHHGRNHAICVPQCRELAIAEREAPMHGAQEGDDASGVVDLRGVTRAGAVVDRQRESSLRIANHVHERRRR